MWRNRTNWLNKELNDYPNSIKEFWDGSKLGEWDDFLIPLRNTNCYICNCKNSYVTFPDNAKVHQININWDENAQRYQFLCDSCSRMVLEEQKLVQELL